MSEERYELNWPGKIESIKIANTPINKILVPDRDESVNFDDTQNLFIEGDNLDALKLLQSTHKNKIKMIYIDPPYNIGKDITYKNDYSENKKDFMKRHGQSSKNANGRFHSNWLSMMYPRLVLSKSLLSDDGVLACAIDENEFANLSLILKEIYDVNDYNHSYVSMVHNPGGQQGRNFSYVNEYLIFIYPSDGKKYLADYKRDEVYSGNLRKGGSVSARSDAVSCFYPITIDKNKNIVHIGDVPPDDFHPESANIIKPDGNIEIWPINNHGVEKKWRYARQSIHKIVDKIEIRMGRESLQVYFNKEEGTMKSVWHKAKYDSNAHGTMVLKKLIKDSGFTYPKSLWAVYDAVYGGTRYDKDAIILDFFAGSSTTAHAIMQLNADDGGNRKFIMVQLPEECKDNKEFKNIADISKERIRRAGNKIIFDKYNCDWDKDIGFKVLKIESSL